MEWVVFGAEKLHVVCLGLLQQLDAVQLGGQQESISFGTDFASGQIEDLVCIAAEIEVQLAEIIVRQVCSRVGVAGCRSIRNDEVVGRKDGGGV